MHSVALIRLLTFASVENASSKHHLDLGEFRDDTEPDASNSVKGSWCDAEKRDRYSTQAGLARLRLTSPKVISGSSTNDPYSLTLRTKTTLGNG